VCRLRSFGDWDSHRIAVLQRKASSQNATLAGGEWNRQVRAHLSPTTLTRRLLDYLILDFRMGAGPLPAKDLLQVLQCAIAARDDLDRGLEGAVSVCFEQD